MLGKKIKKKITLEDFIDYYMEGNMQRFLRKHKNQYPFQLTYSVTFKHLRKSSKKMYKELMSKDIYPNRMNTIMNIFITLDKHFSIGFTSKGWNDYLVIEDELGDIIRDYMDKIRGHQFKFNRGKLNNSLPTKKEALKEQKARGFIDINDWDDYNPKFAHIISNIDSDLYYPRNIPTNSTQSQAPGAFKAFPYVAQGWIGVQGWTRIHIPT